MPSFPFPNTVLLGAGKVGSHLAMRLYEQGIEISQVFSRKKDDARSLAEKINSISTSRFSAIDTNADLYILAISDDAIGKVGSQLRKVLSNEPLVVHTSGATPSTVLEPYFKRYGILYPLQTFSHQRVPDFDKIPVCIFANRKADRELLTRYAKKLSPKVVSMDDAQRAKLHIAAVFVNNFTNYLYQAGEKITAEAGLDFDLLKPLIAETAAKIMNHSPAEMQTGPAVRGDANTIERHLKYLERYPELAELYALISRQIQNA